jgi:cytochrome P450
MSGMQQNDLLDSFLEARDKTSGQAMSNEELTEELLGVYAAAHEPVAIALTYALFLVAKHPEVRTKLMEELRPLNEEQALSPASYPAMRYTKNVVQETLRLYPPVWVSGKRALADDVIQGYKIRKNDNFIYSPVLLHSHPDFWEAPERFDPDRFNNKIKHPFAYFPFSGGAKYCVGSHLAMMILQLCLAEIVLHFKIETDIETVNINPFTTLKPVNRILADVSKR